MLNLSSEGLSLAGGSPAVYLVLAGLCLLLGLRYLKRVLAPFSVVLEAAPAAAVVTLSILIALILLLAALAAR